MSASDPQDEQSYRVIAVRHGEMPAYYRVSGPGRIMPGLVWMDEQDAIRACMAMNDAYQVGRAVGAGWEQRLLAALRLITEASWVERCARLTGDDERVLAPSPEEVRAFARAILVAHGTLGEYLTATAVRS